jgi:TetR/AcrR family transcriptional repressor of nem operon
MERPTTPYTAAPVDTAGAETAPASAQAPATKKGEETRNRILEAATRLIHERGYKNTGLQDILTESGVPRGSFYFYFPSKEALGLALLTLYRARHRAELEATVFPPTGPAIAQIVAFFEHTVLRQMEGGCKQGCLLGNLAAELTDENESLRRAIADVFIDLRDSIARTLARGQATGELTPDFDPSHAAEFLLSVFEGAILMAKARRDPAALTASSEMLNRYLHTLRPAGAHEGPEERRTRS